MFCKSDYCDRPQRSTDLETGIQRHTLSNDPDDWIMDTDGRDFSLYICKSFGRRWYNISTAGVAFHGPDAGVVK